MMTVEQLIADAEKASWQTIAIQTEHGWFAVNEDGTIDAPPDVLESLMEKSHGNTLTIHHRPADADSHTGAG